MKIKVPMQGSGQTKIYTGLVVKMNRYKQENEGREKNEETGLNEKKLT